MAQAVSPAASAVSNFRHASRCYPEASMKYLCLVYGEESKIKAMPDHDCVSYDEAVRAQGKCLASEALHPVASAKTVRVRAGRTTITDGPFAETKEILAGFYLIEAANIDEAAQIASCIPAAREGSVEVRPVRQLDGRAF